VQIFDLRKERKKAGKKVDDTEPAINAKNLK